MIKKQKFLPFKIAFIFCMCLTSFFIANDTNYAAEHNNFTTIEQNKNIPTVEEYENNVKDLPRLNANETMDKFNSGEGFYFYIGRPSCSYCREFSPILKEFSTRISQPIYYYNMDGGDWGPVTWQFLRDHIDLQGTPTLAYIKDGKVVVQQVGTGPNVDELLTIFANCPQ
ncbi:conjugal transfer protein TraF [Paenibacillus sp. FSL M8-0228]|uniref:conjugal transfer protein TraF n=1 Tax=Paenibacillus TaxID=44249 RepID=UPI00083E27B9|nr:conjugal transfer protein TraF [Paenibacillus polymyxa]MBO3285471.1 conjugal transfer protein TraF [Paenibacillus polymyxa]ODB54470.1 thiol reductase thioredoxin [Paenibacillus polymyxa]